MRNKAIIFFLLVLLLAPALSLAQSSNGEVKTIELKNPLACEDAECLLSKILSAFWIIASLLSTLMVLIGALQLMTAAGNPEKVQTAKKTLLYAVIGYAIVILAYSASAIIKGIIENSSSGASGGQSQDSLPSGFDPNSPDPCALTPDPAACRGD